MSEKLKPTPGPWIADNNEGFSPWTIWSRMTPSGNGTPGPVIARIDGDSAEADDSAHLIAEAGTVFHECGLSPRELLELRQALINYYSASYVPYSRDVIYTLAKHKEV